MMVEFALGDRGDISMGTLGTGLRRLLGEPREPLMEVRGPDQSVGGLHVWNGPEGMVGYARLASAGELEAATDGIYRSIVRAASGLNLYRVWNFVPEINAGSPDGMENYKAFCRGRSVAFESAIREGLRPEPSGRLGCGNRLGRAHRGLPRGAAPGAPPRESVQTPAYEYPPEHGPRSPSFSRATVVDRGDTRDVYVSGTSSVTGHGTVAPNDTAGQLDCTIENLRLISMECGLGETIGQGGSCRRHFKIYLRNEGDLGLVSGGLAGRGILHPGDRATYLRADICRSALNVEIEVAVRGAAKS